MNKTGLPAWLSDPLPTVPPDYIEDYLQLKEKLPKPFANKRLYRGLISSTLGCSSYRARVLRKIIVNPYRFGLSSGPPEVYTGVAIDADDIPSDRPIEDLIADRMKASERKHKKSKKHDRTLTMPAEPFGIFVMGDPHVDNEGCDWSALYEHVQLMKSTPGVVACSVGDQLDNWIGRLARCYAESGVTAADGWRLSKWLFDELKFIAVCGGNHDKWAHGPGVDPMKLLTKECGVTCYAPDEIRITMNWRDRPDLEGLVWILRHDFAGRSWFHPTHGPHKEATLDGKCHLLTCGHIHQWGQLTTEQRHGRITHAIRVKGYKRDDSYAKEKGFYEQQYGQSVLIVINPEADEPGRITPFWNLEQGCDYLTKLRT